MQRLDLAVNEKLSKKLISDRTSLGNIDLLKKYYSSISTLIYESRLHFKHLPLGYFIRHLYVFFLCFLWTQYQIKISQIKILRYSTLFLNQFCIGIILWLSYFHIEQRNTYILIIYNHSRNNFFLYLTQFFLQCEFELFSCTGTKKQLPRMYFESEHFI